MALTVQTIEGFVGDAMDEARMGKLHWRVLALVAAGYFFDVLDFTVFRALVPDLIRSGFVTTHTAIRSRPCSATIPTGSLPE